MTYLLPLVLAAVIVGLLAAMPWSKPQPNAVYFLELLRANIGESAQVFSLHRQHHSKTDTLKQAS